MGVTERMCDFLALKAKPNLCVIFWHLKLKEGLFLRLCCCYGNLLCHANYHNLFSSLIEY